MGLSKLFSRNFFVAVCVVMITVIVELHIGYKKQTDSFLEYKTNVTAIVDSLQTLRLQEVEKSRSFHDSILNESHKRQLEFYKIKKLISNPDD